MQSTVGHHRATLIRLWQYMGTASRLEQKAWYDASLSAAMTMQKLGEKRADVHVFVIEYFQTHGSISCHWYCSSIFLPLHYPYAGDIVNYLFKQLAAARVTPRSPQRMVNNSIGRVRTGPAFPPTNAAINTDQVCCDYRQVEEMTLIISLLALGIFQRNK